MHVDGSPPAGSADLAPTPALGVVGLAPAALRGRKRPRSSDSCVDLSPVTRRPGFGFLCAGMPTIVKERFFWRRLRVSLQNWVSQLSSSSGFTSMMSSLFAQVQRLNGQFGYGWIPQLSTHHASSTVTWSMFALHAVESPPGGSAERTGCFGPSSQPSVHSSVSSPSPQICFAVKLAVSCRFITLVCTSWCTVFWSPLFKGSLISAVAGSCPQQSGLWQRSAISRAGSASAPLWRATSFPLAPYCSQRPPRAPLPSLLWRPRALQRVSYQPS